MSKEPDNTPDDDEAIEAAAAAWLVQRDEGFTSMQAAEFSRWCAASPKHAAAVAMLEDASNILGRLPELRENPATNALLDELGRPTLASGTSAGAKVIRFPAAYKIAAAVAACFAVAFSVWFFRAEQPSFAQTYATAEGDYLRVVLPDDSVLELNTATQADVRFTGALRHIALTRGEAHFTVAKNPTRPFVVEAQGIAVRAVGTAFNVRLDRAAVDVLVTEGRVQVTRDGTPLRISDSMDALPADPSTFSAGTRVMISTEAKTLPARVAHVDADTLRDTLAWHNPLLVFNETPLAEVAQQFNRRNRVQLVIGDDDLNRRSVGGNFRADNIEAFVRALEMTNEITAERPDARRIILRKAK